MRKYIIALFILLIPFTSHALDKKIGTINCFKLGLFDTSSKANGGAGVNLLNTSNLTGTVATNVSSTLTGTNTAFLTDYVSGDTIYVSGESVRTVAAIASNTSLTVTVPFPTTASSLAHYRGPRVNTSIKCGANATTIVDRTSDTWTEEGSGFYYLCTNDTITNNNEEECTAWPEGAGSLTGMIAKTPVKFKAVTDTASVTTCDISAATSGLSFAIALCKDEDGSSITLATDMFVGSYMIAYTNGASQCNVVGQGVFVNDLTAGLVTVKDEDMPGSGFSAIPDANNCGVRISP